jgi:WD40 repeat protein/serine/threonine protein kinase
MRKDDLYVLLARGLELIGDEDYSKLTAEPDQNIVSALKAKLSEGEVNRLDKTFMTAIGENRAARRMKPEGHDSSFSTQPRGEKEESPSRPASKPRLISVMPATNQGFDLIPNVRDRYEIKKEQGRGGIGRVLLAFDRHIGRNVALKELLKAGDCQDPVLDEQYQTSFEDKQIRFLKEARITGQLQHPSIVPVYEIGRREDGTYYYTMKLVEGRTLSQAIQECTSLEDGLKLLPHFRDMCHAISFAHSCGVIHRDIKPANVMIGKFGQTVVLDWGIAKILDEADEGGMDGQRLILQLGGSKTVEGSTLGTPAYMSPEQTRGELDRIDELSDVYSLGACLYEMLCGRPPHTGSHVWEIILKVLCEPVHPLEKEPSPPPGELAAIAYKALAKEKEDRYQSAAELAGAIEAYMSGEKVAAYEYSSFELFTRFASKNKPALAAAGVMLLALVFGLIMVGTAFSKEVLSNQKMKAAVSMEQEAKRTAYFHMAQAFSREAAQLEQEKQPLGAKIYAAASLLHNPANRTSPYFYPDFANLYPLSLKMRAEAAATLYEAQHRDALDLEALISTAEANFGSAVSPDGQVVAVGGQDKKIALWDTRTKKQVGELVGHESRVYTIAFSQNGGAVFSGGNDGTVRAFDVQSKRQLWRFNFPGKRVYDVAVSGDGKWVAAAGEGKDIQLLEGETGHLVRKLSGHQDRIHCLAFSPDGKSLASGSYDTTVRLWDVTTGNPLAEMEGHKKEVMGLAFSHDGRRLASGSWDSTIRIWNAQTHEVERVLESPDAHIMVVDFAPDDTRLVSAGGERKVRLWDVETGEMAFAVQAHKDAVYGAYFLGAGDRLFSASVDKTIKFWKAIHADPLFALKGHTGTAWDVQYSGDGKRIASASEDRTVRIMDAQSHELLGVLSGHDGTVYSAAFSPDNKLIASVGGDRRVKIWNANTFQELFELDGHDDAIYAVVFSKDGTKLATGGPDHTIRLWDLQNQKPLRVLRGHANTVYRMLFTEADSRLVSVATDSTIRLWDVATGAQLGRIDTPDWNSGLDMTKDEKWLFTSGKDPSIVMWELSTLKKVREFSGHEQWVNSVKVSPDGSVLASSSDDGTVRLWSVNTTEPLLILSATPTLGLDFSPDGRTLAVADGNQIKLFPIDLSLLEENPQVLLAKIELAAGLTLSGFVLENMEPKRFAELQPESKRR